MHGMSDEELVRQVKEGTIRAYEELVSRYQRKLFSFVYRVVWNENDALEVVQDTLFRIYQTIERVDLTRRFSTYAFAIAKNTAISYVRKRKPSVSFDEELDAIEEDEYIFESLVREETIATIRTAVDSLPDKYRQVIRLYYFHDLSYEEICKKIRMPINTVRTLIRRAKIQLKERLQI